MGRRGRQAVDRRGDEVRAVIPMTQSPKLIDPAEVFQHANAFYVALEQLHATSDRPRFERIGIPVVVLSAFAAELFFKCLLSLEAGKPAPTHLLYDLFKKLSPATQARLEELWAENSMQRSDVLDRLDKSSGRRLPRDLRSNLITGSDAFRLVRYIYEGGADFDFLLGDLPKILRRVIFELKPEWNSSNQAAELDATVGQRIRVRFNVSDKVLGSDVELQDGSLIRLNADQTEAKLFRETRTGRLFDTLQMISNLLMKTNTRKQDLITPAAAAEAFERGICIGKPNLDMSFTPGSIELCLGDTARDIKRIVFDVELTVRPNKGT
jgi:hypothetical protein